MKETEVRRFVGVLPSLHLYQHIREAFIDALMHLPKVNFALFDDMRLENDATRYAKTIGFTKTSKITAWLEQHRERSR